MGGAGHPSIVHLSTRLLQALVAEATPSRAFFDVLTDDRLMVTDDAAVST